MSNLDHQVFYKRNLPHFQPPGATLFVTFRLAGSLPTRVVRGLQREYNYMEDKFTNLEDLAEREDKLYEEQHRYFGKLDNALDRSLNGPFWLNEPRIAELVSESLHYRDGKVFAMDAFALCQTTFTS